MFHDKLLKKQAELRDFAEAENIDFLLVFRYRAADGSAAMPTVGKVTSRENGQGLICGTPDEGKK
jgi:hypothetical protein